MVFLLSLTYSWRTKVREITPYIKQTICWWLSVAIQYPLLTSVTLFTIRVCKVMWLVGGPLVLRFFRIQSSWIYAWTHADEMWSEVAWVSPRKNHWIAMYKSMFSLPAPGDCSHCWCGIPTIGKDLQCWTPTKGLSLRPMQELANTKTKLLRILCRFWTQPILMKHSKRADKQDTLCTMLQKEEHMEAEDQGGRRTRSEVKGQIWETSCCLAVLENSVLRKLLRREEEGMDASCACAEWREA